MQDHVFASREATANRATNFYGFLDVPTGVFSGWYSREFLDCALDRHRLQLLGCEFLARRVYFRAKGSLRGDLVSQGLNMAHILPP